MNIQIKDSNQQIRFSIEELKALQTVIAMAEGHPVYSNNLETFIVARAVLTSIINDLEEASGAIDEELKNVQQG